MQNPSAPLQLMHRNLFISAQKVFFGFKQRSGIFTCGFHCIFTCGPLSCAAQEPQGLSIDEVSISWNTQPWRPGWKHQLLMRK